MKAPSSSLRRGPLCKPLLLAIMFSLGIVIPSMSSLMWGGKHCNCETMFWPAVLGFASLDERGGALWAITFITNQVAHV